MMPAPVLWPSLGPDGPAGLGVVVGQIVGRMAGPDVAMTGFGILAVILRQTDLPKDSQTLCTTDQASVSMVASRPDMGLPPGPVHFR